MFSTTVMPRFAETDALGHINNAAVPTWFEEGRTGIFRIFNPELSLERWNLILRRLEVDYLAQLRLYQPVTVETEVAAIGTTSVTIRQRAIQSERVAAAGIAVMVHFDYATQKSTPIPDTIRAGLGEHLVA